MKKIILLISVISILFLVGCSKNEVAENNNIVENQQQNESVDNIEKEENSDFSDRIAAARAEIENLTSIGGYGVDYTSIKQNGEKYLLKIAFSKYIDSSDPDYPVLDGNDIKIIEIELNAEDKIVVNHPWILLDGSNQEMQAGEITVAELCNFTYFSYDTHNGLYFENIDENNIYVWINMAGLT